MNSHAFGPVFLLPRVPLALIPSGSILPEHPVKDGHSFYDLGVRFAVHTVLPGDLPLHRLWVADDARSPCTCTVPHIKKSADCFGRFLVRVICDCGRL